MSTPPGLQLTNVTWQPPQATWSLLLSWSVVTPGSGSYVVQMQLYDSQQLTTPVGNPVTSGVNAGGGTWSTTAAGATLNPGTVYWMAVAGALQSSPTQVGPWSNALPILYLGPPAIQSDAFDGKSLDVQWSPPPAGTAVTDYTLTIQTSQGFQLVVLHVGSQGIAIPSGNSLWRFDLSQLPLALAGAQLTIVLTPLYMDPATYATSYGPTASANLYIQQPQLLYATWQSGSASSGLTYSVTATNLDYGTTAPKFQVSVFGNGVLWYGPVLLNSSLGNNCVIALALQPSFGLDLTVALAQADSVSVGPQSPAMMLIGAAPTIQEAAYSLTGPSAGTLAVTVAGIPPQSLAVLTVWNGTSVVGTLQIPGASGSLAVAPASGLTATVAAAAGSSIGPGSAAINLITTQPALISVAYDGNVVRMNWSSPGSVTGLAGFVASVLSSAVLVASVEVNDVWAAVPIPNAPETLSAQVAIFGAPCVGPPCSPVPLITGVPQVQSAVTNVMTGLTTVTWSAVGNSSYSVQLYSGGVPSGSPIPASSASFTLPQPLLPNSDFAVAIAATTTSGAVAVTGPASPPFALPTAQPLLLGADYDGVYLTVSWVPAEGATGYVISVLGSGSTTAPAYTGQAAGTAASAVFQPGLTDTSQTYTVTIQAMVGSNSGPSAPAVNLLQPAFFQSVVPAATSWPYLVPASALSFPASTISVYLPNLGVLTGLPKTQGPFTLQANPDTTTSGAFPNQLVIANSTEVWQFTPPVAIRATLQSDYVTFLQLAEAAGVNAAGVSVLQQAISRSMPQTFVETLYYAYGLNMANGCADLRPGMVLRVVFNEYTNVGGAPAPQWLNGYIGGLSVDYDVASYIGAQGGWTLGLDAFIAQLVAGNYMQVSAPPVQVPQQTEAGLADAADLFYPAFQQPFYRLFFPSQLQSPTGTGTVLASANFVLAAASSYTNLVTTVGYPTATNAVAYFRGRALIKLCIRVLVNGVEEVVPIGTTVGNLLDRYGWKPPSATLPLRGLMLERSLGPAVLNPAAYTPGIAWRVRIDWMGMQVYGGGLDSLSLPLLHGDSLTIPS